MTTTWINRQFGTFRGLVRLGLAYAELGTGRLARFQLRRPESVRRLVFVCHGNICRSAIAHRIALTEGSPKQAVAAAARAQVDMSTHRATDFKDFDVQPGDLFLVMEVRQAHKLRQRLGARDDVHVCLLGMWGSPVMPHLHDPFTLSDAYFDTCFSRVKTAVRRLGEALPHLKTIDAGQRKVG
jgi:protein-tyrosine phosphatase